MSDEALLNVHQRESGDPEDERRRRTGEWCPFYGHHKHIFENRNGEVHDLRFSKVSIIHLFCKCGATKTDIDYD
jgi:hypothetical protein